MLVTPARTARYGNVVPTYERKHFIVTNKNILIILLYQYFSIDSVQVIITKQVNL